MYKEREREGESERWRDGEREKERIGKENTLFIRCKAMSLKL